MVSEENRTVTINNFEFKIRLKTLTNKCLPQYHKSTYRHGKGQTASGYIN